MALRSLCVIILIISPVLTQVIVNPPNQLVSTLNGRAQFSCTISPSVGVMDVQWLLNETLLEVPSSVNATIQFFPNFGGGNLVFNSLSSDLNMTRISCKALYNDGRNKNSTGFTLLLLQGLLTAVESLMLTVNSSDITLTWTPPFSLDIQSVHPDISGYCVDVVSSTSSVTLHSDCNITQTTFSHPLLESSKCHDISITVTPVNVIGRGEQNSVLYSQAIPAPRALTTKIVPILTSINGSSILEYKINMTSFVCSAELILTDKSSGEVINLHPSANGSSITFTSEGLNTSTLYTGILNATNVNGSALSTVDISTHDIVGVTISDFPIRIQVEYVLNSQALGGFFTFMFVGGSSSTAVDFSKSAYLFIDKNTSLNYMLPFQLSTGVYIVYAYDIEDVCSGMINPAIRASKVFTGNTQASNQPRSQEIEDCNSSIITTGKSHVISVLCTPSSNSPSAQAGIVMIVQNELNVGQLLVNQTEQDAPTGPITVQVKGDGSYHVAIFPKSMENGLVHSNLAYSVKLSVVTEASTETATTGRFTPTLAPASVSATLIISIVGAGLGVLILTLGGILLAVQCWKVDPLKVKSSSKKVKPIEKESPDTPDYAEVGEVKESFMYTRNVLYGAALNVTTSPIPTEYDYVKPDKSQWNDAVHVKHCAATPQQ